MSNITQTFGKLLNTVSTVADAATKIVDTSTSGVDMLDTFVRSQKQKQDARTAVDMSTFYEDLQNEAALENAYKADALEKALASDPTLKKHFENQHKNLNDIINTVRTKYQPE
jgi:hypothetical protein